MDRDQGVSMSHRKIHNRKNKIDRKKTRVQYRHTHRSKHMRFWGKPGREGRRGGKGGREGGEEGRKSRGRAGD